MNKAIVILLISTLALGTASAYLHRQLQSERARADALESRLKGFDQSRERLPSIASTSLQPDTQVHRVAAASEPIGAKTALATFTLLATPRGGIETSSADEQKRMRVNFQEQFVRQQRALMNDPEYREALRLQQRQALAQGYADLPRELGISADEADRLLDLLADQQLRTMQDMQPFDAESQTDPAAVAEKQQRKFEEQQRTNRSELEKLLGSEGMQRWQEYQNNSGTRWRVQQLSSALDAAGVPLREDQRQSVRDALAAADKQMQSDMQAQAMKFSARGSISAAEQLQIQEEQIDQVAIARQRVRDSLAGVLSPDQLKTYQRMNDAELAMQRAQLRVQRTQLEAGSDAVFATPGMAITSNGAVLGSTTTLSVQPTSE